MAFARTKVIDKGMRSLVRDFKAFNRLKLTVGFQGPSGRQRYPGTDKKPGPTVAQVAAWNEATRPFMRRTTFENRKRIARSLAIQSGKALRKQKKARDALAGTGAMVVKLMEKEIKTAFTWAKPLSKATIAKKGHPNPLWDTKLMLRSVTYAVRGRISGRVIKSGKR